MNEQVAEAIRGGDAAEATRLLIEAARQGSTVARFYRHRDDIPFPVELLPLGFGQQREIEIYVNFVADCIQREYFQLDRVEIE